MAILRFLGGVIAIFIAFWIAVKVLGWVLRLLGLVISLVSVAIAIGLIALLGYGAYRFFVSAARRME